MKLTANILENAKQLEADVNKASPIGKTWLNTLHEHRYFQRYDLDEMKKLHDTLVSHLSHLEGFPMLKYVDPKTYAWELATFPEVATGTSQAAYVAKLRSGRLRNIADILEPPPLRDLFDQAANSSTSTSTVEIILPLVDKQRKGVILAGVACRNHPALFQKFRKKINDPEVDKKALEFLEGISALPGSKIEIGRKTLRSHMTDMDNSWEKYTEEGFEPNTTTSLSALRKLLALHTSEITDPVQQVMGVLLGKVLRNPPKGAQVLLVDALELRQPKLFTKLLAAGLNPNFEVRKPHMADSMADSKSFSAMLFEKTLELKDTTWLERAFEAGLKEEKDPFWQEIVRAFSSNSAPKAFIRQVAHSTLAKGSIPDLAEFTKFAEPLFPHASGKLGMLCSIFQPLLGKPNLELPPKQEQAVQAVVVDIDLI